LTNFQKKKRLFRPKKQAGAELKHKKGVCKSKIGEIFENKVQKLTNFTEKKDFLGQKKKLGLSLRRKRKIFWAKNWGKK